MRNQTAIFLFLCTVAWSQNNFEPIAEAAKQAREANEVPKAIELYQSALKLQPDWPEGLFYLASLYYDSDQFAPAEQALAHFVKVTPHALPAFGLLGLCEFETGHYREALTHLEQAPAQSGQMDAVLRFHKAQLLTKLGQYDKALPVFASFVNNSDVPASVVIPLGLAALRQPKMASEVSPADQPLDAAAGRTAAAILSGDSTQSESRLSDLLTRFANSPGVHCMKAYYVIAQNPQLATDEFKRELSIDPANSSANVMLAWLLLNNRDDQAALPYAKIAIAGAPEDRMSQYVYGRCLSETNDVQQGITYLEKAVQADPQNLEAHLALASAYSKAGRTDDARRERTRSIELAREVAPVYMH